MDSEIKLKKTVKKLDRISLSPANLKKIETWLSLAQVNSIGSVITRSDIANWVIEQHAPELTGKELKVLTQAHSDEVRLAKWAYEELKAAKKRGENTTLAEVLLRQKQSVQGLNAPRGPYKRGPKLKFKSDLNSKQTSIFDSEISSKPALDADKKINKTNENAVQN